jgi:hypothetical protein
LPEPKQKQNKQSAKGEFIMKQTMNGINGMMIAAVALLIAVSSIKAQDNADTLSQITPHDQATVVAMVGVTDFQSNQTAQTAGNLEPASVAAPEQKAGIKTRNFEEAGNALGFVLPALTMIGMILLAAL